MTRPKGTGGKAQELSSEEIKRIDKCITGTTHEYRNRAMFYLGLGSGMRIAEICNLKIKDIAPFGKVQNRIVLEKHSTKSKKSRTVAFSNQAAFHLKKYLTFLSEQTDTDSPLFFSQMHPKHPMSTNTAILTLKKMFKDAGIENASSHSLRRTHANKLRRNGADLQIIKEQLGHSSLAITERYFDVDPLEVQMAVNSLKF